ncbi:DUF421 domain-containing protein [Bacillus hwajinpoensis]|uniref:DUF421 domain-containing protein n=1 Tax=Guptibacillus hwajinpoensis TaxID=208199 RepID=A0A845F3X3_9BACL|nr:DUF421 domain-containing protein [Pseudalkalibacillus hwajinpoensis]MYL65742.1 DUF421 domain-containing protein [Pseudalkalibacillus hwajinpoensis]
MLSFIGTVLILFLVTIVVIRFMGKSALAQFTPHDLTALFFIVTLAIKAIKVEGVTQALIGIAIIIIIHISLSKLSLYKHLNRFVIGEPTILIKHGKLIKMNLKKSRFSLSELLSSIRSKGYADVTNIKYAILEPNGEISVLPKEESMPVTPKILKCHVDYSGLPIAVVIEGKIQYKNLELIHKDKEWLLNEIKAAGVANIKHIFYASVRDDDYSLTVDNGKGNLGTLK